MTFPYVAADFFTYRPTAVKQCDDASPLPVPDYYPVKNPLFSMAEG
jgi:hypothetical protein